MTDHEQLETMLRSSLNERAGDVDTTPALYERVQRQATRGTWLRRGVALAGAAAAVVVAVTVIPSLLPAGPLEPDIADTPDAVEPTEPAEPSEPEPSPGTLFSDPLLEANVAFADANGLVNVGQRAVTSPAPVVSLAVSPFWTEADGAVAAGLEDGRIGVVQQAASGDRFDLLVDAAANGGGVVFSPDGEAIAWIEGTDLHILPLASGPEGERVPPLEGDVPNGLRIEQWFYGADAQSIIASDPAGGIWSIPMDDADAYDSAPTSPAFQLDMPAFPGVTDSALLPDLSRVSVGPVGVADNVALQLQIGEVFVGAPEELVDARAVDLTTDGSGSVVLHDPTTGIGVRFDGLAGEAYEVEATWQVPGTTAVVPLPSNPNGTNDPVEEAGTEAAALGLPTDAPVVGTAATDLLVRTADGQVQTIAVYGQPTEATLGRLAVRPGSTLEEGMVAVESFSEGEHSIRFVALRDDTATPVGDVLITDGPLTGLVWSEDGGEIAFSDTVALHYASVDLAGVLAGGGEVLSRDAGPVLDWTWTEIAHDATGGILTVAVAGGTGVEMFEVGRDADAVVRLLEPVGGADRIVLDAHTSPGAAIGPEVVAQLGDGRAVLSWSADGDRSGQLPDPGQLGGDVRVQVSGGQVVVMGDSRQVLVTFDGEVIDLPTAADWDILD